MPVKHGIKFIVPKPKKYKVIPWWLIEGEWLVKGELDALNAVAKAANRLHNLISREGFGVDAANEKLGKALWKLKQLREQKK